jgi:hypothetical protein
MATVRLKTEDFLTRYLKDPFKYKRITLGHPTLDPWMMAKGISRALHQPPEK